MFIFGCCQAVDDQTKIEASNNNAPANENSWEDCYTAAYIKFSELSAEDLIMQGEYKTKDEIPEQELVPQGARIILEEDCKEEFK